MKWVLEPDSSEMAKQQKQLKRTAETEKVSGKISEERIPIKENKETRSNDKQTAKSINSKFHRKIKIKNAKEFKNFQQKQS